MTRTTRIWQLWAQTEHRLNTGRAQSTGETESRDSSTYLFIDYGDSYTDRLILSHRLYWVIESDCYILSYTVRWLLYTWVESKKWHKEDKTRSILPLVLAKLVSLLHKSRPPLQRTPPHQFQPNSLQSQLLTSIDWRHVFDKWMTTESKTRSLSPETALLANKSVHSGNGYS